MMHTGVRKILYTVIITAILACAVPCQVAAAPGYAFSQKYSAYNVVSSAFRNYGVSSVLMDSRGRIWVGTLNGLYVNNNGKTFTLFPLQNANDKIINRLLIHEGMLYVGTNEGVNRIDLHSLSARALMLKDVRGNVIHNYCMPVRVDKAKNLLFYTGYNTGAYYEHHLPTGKATFLFNHSDGFRAFKVNKDDKLKALWAVETTGLLEHRLDGDSIKSSAWFKGYDGTPSLTIHEAHIDATDTIWCATNKGLLGVDVNTHGYKILTFPAYDTYELTDVVLWGGRIICATKNAGIIIWNRLDNSMVNIAHKPDDPFTILSNKVWKLNMTADKLLVAATDRGMSVIALEGNMQHAFNPVGDANVHHISKGRGTWTAGIGNNIFVLRPADFKIIETLSLANDEYSITAEELEDNSRLIITNKRVFWWVDGSLKSIQVAGKHAVCERIVKENDSSYFLCGQTGIYRWRVGKVTAEQLYQTDREPYSWYSAVIPVNDSVILANAYLSFIKALVVQGDSLRPLTLLKTFGNVNHWLKLSDSKVLLGSTNGVSVFDLETLDETPVDSNFNEHIFAFVRRGGDTLLIGEKEIYNYKNGRITSRQNVYAGFHNISNINRLLADDRYIWFSNGYELYREPFWSKVPVQHFFYVNVYENNIPVDNSIEVPAEQNLILQANSVCYAPYINYKVQYRLSDIEPGWNTLEGAHIRYTQLQPGNYTLYVQAVAGTQTLFYKKIQVVVKPAWYQTVLAKIALILIITAVVAALFFLRVRAIRRKADNVLALQRRMNELENKALRSQMNPHFLFNTLNSINHYILNNEMQEASHYLTRFSKLVRLVLDNSRREWISLERELEALNIYLELEMMRRNNEFDYSIALKKDVAASSFLVPPLILQPFVENAIWHGLSTIARDGFIEITVNAVGDDGICIVIEDNGIGYIPGNKEESKKDHDSFGMAGTRDRLQLMHPDNRYVIEPLHNEEQKLVGTRVSIYIYND